MASPSIYFFVLGKAPVVSGLKFICSSSVVFLILSDAYGCSYFGFPTLSTFAGAFMLFWIALPLNYLYYTLVFCVCLLTIYTKIQSIFCVFCTLDFCVHLMYTVYSGEEGFKYGFEGGVSGLIQYKGDILALLKDNGFTTYKLRKERLLAENTIQQIRNGELVSWTNLDRICAMLHCQPGDILEFKETE